MQNHIPGISPDEVESTRWVGNGKSAVLVVPPGTKLDHQKPRWSLLPPGTISQIIEVLLHGAKKYSVNNWMTIEDARRRYYDAAMRHIEASWMGERNDPESRLSHLAHAATCLLFLLWFEGQDA